MLVSQIGSRLSGGTATVVVAAADAGSRQKVRADYVCDGTADDVQINAALSQVGASGGGMVFLTAGNYTLADTIKIPSDTILEGAGHGTRLAFAASVGDKTMITNNCGYTPGSRHATGNKNLTLRDMYIDGDKSNRGAGADSVWTVGFNTVENLTIGNVTIMNGWTAALRTEFCSYVVIAGNRIHNPGDDCIAINEETYYCSCYGNKLSDAGKGGKSYGASNGIEVQDGCRDVAVFGNSIDNCTADGIEVSIHSGKSASVNVAVNANTIRNCSCGVSVEGLSDTPQTGVSVTNNQIIHTLDSANYGLQGKYTERLILVGNVVTTQYYGGILRESSLRCVIADNHFRNSLSAGNTGKCFLFMNTLTNIRFDGNVVDNFGWKGLEISGTVTNMHVVNNHIVGCTHGSSSCVRWDSPTSTRCVVNGNHLQGTHWSYDGATSTFDVLASGWSETWNTKET